MHVCKFCLKYPAYMMLFWSSRQHKFSLPHVYKYRNLIKYSLLVLSACQVGIFVYLTHRIFYLTNCYKIDMYYCVLRAQFYIQLVYKPHFKTWILLFESFGQLRIVKKRWIWVFLSNFWGWFFQLVVGKKRFKFFFENIVASTLKSCI